MKIDIFNTNKKYNIIYADPPWAYHDTLGGNAKMGAMPYPDNDAGRTLCNANI